MHAMTVLIRLIDGPLRFEIHRMPRYFTALTVAGYTYIPNMIKVGTALRPEKDALGAYLFHYKPGG